MDFKKLTSEAGSLFNKAKQSTGRLIQFTEEKLGQAEKTELDAHFENLLQRSDKTREWTETILMNTEGLLQPNPTARYEDMFYQKLDKKKRDRLTATETLGESMINAGNDFGPGTAYGSALIKVGQTENKLGQAERDFIHSSANNFMQPLKAFLEGDMKTLQKERKLLETKRLDLDSCKTRLRRAKSQTSKEQDAEMTQIIANAEQELRTAQAEFDRQAEITKLLCEGISSTHAHHLRCLHDLIEAQHNYYSQSQQYMSDLQKQLGSQMGEPNNMSYFSNSVNTTNTMVGGNPIGGGSPSVQTSSFIPGVVPAQDNRDTTPRRAKVLYDYDAADHTELSLKADEIIQTYRIPDQSEWLIGERGSQRGRVPITYLELLD